MRIAVTGATGLVGSHAAAALLEAGHDVRALVRDPSRLDVALAPFSGPEAAMSTKTLSADRRRGTLETIRGDVGDAASVADGLAGCDGLVHAAGVFSSDRRAAARLRAVNVEGTRTVLDAARRAGLHCTVHVSSILALFPPRTERFRAADAVATPRERYAATKAAADRIARERQAAGDPISIVYPAACQGPDDPTFSVGPQLVADALRAGQVLVTEGGLAYTDVRDLARLIVRLFDADDPHGPATAAAPSRIMAPSFYLAHDAYHALLCRLTGRDLRAQRVPGWLLRGMGAVGDGLQRVGIGARLTSEAAAVLTRSVPVEDGPARALLGDDVRSAEASFRDLLCWMVATGRVAPAEVGDLAPSGR